MKITRIVEHVGLPAVIETADLAKGTMVEITDDETVDKHAGAGAICIGFVRKPAREAGGGGTIETPFRATGEAKADGALVAGGRFKMSTEAPAGTQRVVAADDDDQSAGLVLGVVWKGAANNGTAKLLFY